MTRIDITPIEQARAELATLREENARLREENAKLRSVDEWRCEQLRKAQERIRDMQARSGE